MDANITLTDDKKQFSQRFYLAAGECNPEGELPLTLLVSRMIEVATGHANAWGVGYRRLIEDNQGWVLSRVTVELSRYPRVDEHYRLTTWVEDYNRHFSQRNMELTDDEGNTLGYIRTIWMVINFKTRESVDISKLSYIAEHVSDKPCPSEPQRRQRPFEPEKETSHTFGYADCDSNRHVNTLRYLDLIMNQFPLEWHDSHRVSRLELAFVSETLYGDTVQVITGGEPLDRRVDIAVDNQPHVRSRLVFVSREIKNQ